MSALPVPVPLGNGQTPTSFASSLAAAHGVPAMRDFLRHMNIRLDRLGGGDRRELDRLAELGNADPDQLASSWIVGVKGGMALLGGEKLRNGLMRDRFRICPACIQDDIASRSGPIQARPFLRGAWAVHAVGTCITHRTPLVCTSRPIDPYLRNDFAAYAQKHRDELDELAAVTQPVIASAADAWMHDRLTFHADQGLLGSLHFHVAVRLCEIVGAILLFGLSAVPGKLSEPDLSAARERGYEVASCGADSIRLFLATLDDRFWKTAHAAGGVMLYGPLYAWLQANIENSDFEPIRELVKMHVVNTLPVGPGDVFLGPVEHRRWHSVHSAAKQYGLHPKRLRKVLAEKSYIGTDHEGLPDGRVVFEAEPAAPFLASVTASVPAPVARQRLNVSMGVFNRIVRSGLVQPIAGNHLSGDVRPHYSQEQLDQFLKTLLGRALESDGRDADMLAIAPAVTRVGCTAIEIIKLILADRLERIEFDPGKNGIASILVSVAEVREKTVLHNHGGLSLREVERHLQTTTGTVGRLVQHGLLPPHTALNPVKRCPQTVVMPEDLAAFTEKYVSLYELASKGRWQIAKLQEELDKSGVDQAFDHGPATARFYIRSDAEHIARRPT
jgi:hypothetical protein